MSADEKQPTTTLSLPDDPPPEKFFETFSINQPTTPDSKPHE